jgi:predicted RNase H-like HicB family nuclease
MFFRPARTITVRIDAKVQWSFAQDPDSGEWIGVCPDLNLNAVGDTFAELQQCVSEAMELLFLDLFREGQLEVFLRKHGWTPQIKLPKQGSTPRFDTSYVTRLTSPRELMSANT